MGNQFNQDNNNSRRTCKLKCAIPDRDLGVKKKVNTTPSVTEVGIPPTKIFFVLKSLDSAEPFGIVLLISTCSEIWPCKLQCLNLLTEDIVLVKVLCTFRKVERFSSNSTIQISTIITNFIDKNYRGILDTIHHKSSISQKTVLHIAAQLCPQWQNNSSTCFQTNLTLCSNR